jgi:hypothetical protein
MTAGPLVAAVGVAGLSRIGADAAYFPDVLLPMVLLGAGLTLTVTPLTTTVLGAVDAEHAGLASGVNNAVARTGGLLSVAILPVLTGLDPAGFSEAGQLGPAFVTAMLVCAGLLAVGGLVSLSVAPSRRTVPAQDGVEQPAGCPRRHCAVDVPPVAVGRR